jgi:transcriptional regulator with XRE-family HTH domain
MQRPWVTSTAYETAIKAVVAARQDAGLTQRGLADLLGKSRSFVSKLESRERRLDIIEFIVVCRAIGIRPKDMITHIEGLLPSEISY